MTIQATEKNSTSVTSNRVPTRPASAWLRAASLVLALFVLFPHPRSTAAEPAAGEFDEGMETYHQTAATGRVARLQDRLERGEARLDYAGRPGYLPALLTELGVPAASQMLVFSKTSPHKSLITPRNPRALYFNDNVAVAFVPGAAELEIAASDPNLGTVFYTLAQQPAGRPRFERDDRCLECHASSKSLGVAGWLARSFATAPDGEVNSLGGTPMVTHRTPIAARWGGYYVTGDYGSLAHLGNRFTPDAGVRPGEQKLAANPAPDLGLILEAGKYLATGSDIVALLVLEHQAHLQNLLIKLNEQARWSLRTTGDLQNAEATARAVLKYLLLTDETPLSGPVRGSPDFARQYLRQGPRDKQGRSLREFDLQTRIFKYPCSPMIYSDAFEALPSEVKKHLYHQLWQVLAGEDSSLRSAGLTGSNRQAIREILVETKGDLPSYWHL